MHAILVQTGLKVGLCMPVMLLKFPSYAQFMLHNQSLNSINSTFPFSYNYLKVQNHEYQQSFYHQQWQPGMKKQGLCAQNVAILLHIPLCCKLQLQASSVNCIKFSTVCCIMVTIQLQLFTQKVMKLLTLAMGHEFNLSMYTCINTLNSFCYIYNFSQQLQLATYLTKPLPQIAQYTR